jgi:hypothetical protein
LQALFERVLVGEESASHRCVNYHDRRRLFIVPASEKSPLQKRYA